MPMTSAQLVTLACQVARCPGYTSQGGQFLNLILSDLCEGWDFELTKAAYLFNFNPGLVAQIGPSIYGGGPYPLPADFLRCAGAKALTFWDSGNPYMPERIELDEMDQQIQMSGNANYPTLFTTDLSLYDEAAQGLAAPALYLYQPPSGAFAAQLRYYRQMPDIVTPETSATVPWFPNQGYLQTALAAKLMELAGDSRRDAFEAAAGRKLREYLTMKDDPEGRSKTVTLDRRRYGHGDYAGLKNTKRTGW